MIEAVEERQALVEVSLRLWRTCRVRPRIGTQTFKERVLGSEASVRERQAKKDADHPSHCFHIIERCLLRLLENSSRRAGVR